MRVETHQDLATEMLQWPYSDKLATTGVANLKELAENLRSRKHAHEVFDFSTYNSSYTRFGEEPISTEKPCGTSGCAIGDMPLLRPDSFVFEMTSYGSASPVLRGDLATQAMAWGQTVETHYLIKSSITPQLSGMYWFQLTNAMYTHLFMPENQCDGWHSQMTHEERVAVKNTKAYGGTYFGDDATANDVASNIEAFISKVYSTWDEIKEEWHKLHQKGATS
jgi:hypothetical protein